jgi:cell wall-associated NlpC family hydrolase
LSFVARPSQAQNILLRPSSTSVADLVIDEAMKYLGTPYRWGGKTPNGFDCAGFTRFIYGKFGVALAPSAAPQYKAGPTLKNNEINKGDLVFYGGRGGSKSIGHVGIVTEVNENGFYFIHSATSTGITISHSSEPYYKSRYKGACRVVDKVVSNLPANNAVTEKNNVPIYRQMIFPNSTNFKNPIPLAQRIM